MITRLRRALLDSNLPSSVVASRLTIHQPTMSEYVNGTRLIPDRHLVLIANLLTVHPNELVGWCGEAEYDVYYAVHSGRHA